ncbi:MAG: hypothetical protein PVF28_06670 [Thioalkalispiraceae bacterium]|jgi:hypothetical protein
MADKGKDPNRTDEDLLEVINQQLNAAEQSLSNDDLRDLRLARARAIESLGNKNFLIRHWQPLAGVVTAASIVAIVIGLQGLQTATVDLLPADLADNRGTITGVQSVEDLSLLSTSDELEFYEDLEFYQWLAFEENTG